MSCTYNYTSAEKVSSKVGGIVSFITLVSSNAVPGDGGSRIEAKLNKTWVPHYFCYKKSDWFELWLNVHYLAPEAIDCWADNMRLRYVRWFIAPKM